MLYFLLFENITQGYSKVSSVFFFLQLKALPSDEWYLFPREGLQHMCDTNRWGNATPAANVTPLTDGCKVAPASVTALSSSFQEFCQID